MTLNSKIPDGPLHEKWDNYLHHAKLVSPANKKKLDVLVVGTGLAGASAAASLAELGYNVKVFCVQDSPRRAHSIAAQGGINAAKNYPNDGDSVWNLFYDTIKGGDFRSREGNVYRLAQVSNAIIDQCVAQGVPFARDYGGELTNRSFGGAQVSRTFYARGQTGQQLLLGAYQAMLRQIDLGKVELFARREMLDLVVVDGHARGIIVRNLVDGTIEKYAGHAVVLATGGYGRAYYLSTNAFNSNATAAWRCYKRGAYFANPAYVQIHPTCIPQAGDYQSKLTLMSESLRNDGRVWVPKKKEDIKKPANQIPREDRDYYLETRYPSFGNLVPRDVASRNAKAVCDEGRGVGAGRAVYLDFTDAIAKQGKAVIEDKYGNLFHMYEKITAENPYEVPMKIYPAIHYTMGGLWVDYELQSTIPGLFVAGEANFSDHGANRLGASALMQGLADGYFVLPFTMGNYLADHIGQKVDTNHAAFTAAENDVKTQIAGFLERGKTGTKTVNDYYRELGEIMWDDVGMARTKESLEHALVEIAKIKHGFETNLKLVGTEDSMNKMLEIAGRVADFIELGELMARDALHREESCGGHFREEFQTADGEALRDDANFAYVGAWQYTAPNQAPALHKEPLVFENVELSQRSYK